MESWISLSHWQQPATSPCSEPAESSRRLPYHFLKICFTIILTSTPRSSKWSQVFPPKPYMHLSCHICRSPAHLMLDLNIRITFGEEQRSEISSACSLLHSLVASFLLWSVIFLALYSLIAYNVSKFLSFYSN
jgi:hypothetical protein